MTPSSGRICRGGPAYATMVGPSVDRLPGASPGHHTGYRILALDVDGTLLDRSGAPAPDRRGRRPRRPSGDPPGPLHGPALSPGPAGRRAARARRPARLQLGGDRQGPPAATGRSGGPTSTRGCSPTARRLPRSRRAGRLVHRPPARGPRLPRRAPTRPAGRCSTTTSTRTGRTPRSTPAGPDRAGPGRTIHLCAIGDRAGDARLRAGRRSAASPAGSGRSSRGARATPGRCARSSATTPASGRPCSTWPSSGASTPRRSVAVGDDMNDLPMIVGAGLGVAMGHAPAGSSPPPTTSPATTTRTAWPCSSTTSCSPDRPTRGRSSGPRRTPRRCPSRPGSPSPRRGRDDRGELAVPAPPRAVPVAAVGAGRTTTT